MKETISSKVLYEYMKYYDQDKIVEVFNTLSKVFNVNLWIENKSLSYSQVLYSTFTESSVIIPNSPQEMCLKIAKMTMSDEDISSLVKMNFYRYRRIGLFTSDARFKLLGAEIPIEIAENIVTSTLKLFKAGMTWEEFLEKAMFHEGNQFKESIRFDAIESVMSVQDTFYDKIDVIVTSLDECIRVVKERYVW